MIFIFSPQDWGHQFISKHHYAVAFSKKNKTFFFEPTTCKLGKYQIRTFHPFPDNKNLSIIKIYLPFPDVIRFKANAFFKSINAIIIKHWVKKRQQKPELIIDFGCHKLIKNWKFIDCRKKVYFPVDDYKYLPIEKRGCNAFYSVSVNIQEKFNTAGIDMKFMNHGLNHWFAKKAEKRLQKIKQGIFKKPLNGINIAYSGNLGIKFLDRELVLQLVSTYKEYQFHFFGKNKSPDPKYNEWLVRLRGNKNVHLHVQLSVNELAERLFTMDAMLLCYKPDNKNYHAENSHKINEYLSTGMPLLTTPVSVLNDKDMYYQLDFGDDEMIRQSFQAAIDEVINGSKEKMTKRITYSLNFRYDVLTERLSNYNDL